MDESQQLHITRKMLVEYERKFKEEHGRKPSKEEIKHNDEMRKYYKLYWKLKDNSNPMSLSSTLLDKPIPEKPSKKAQQKKAAPGLSPNSNALVTVYRAEPKDLPATGDQELDRFYSLGNKLRDNTGQVFKSLEVNKSLNYSLGSKRKWLLEKSKEANEEIRIKQLTSTELENTKQKEDKQSLSESKVLAIEDPAAKESANQNTVSLLESQVSGVGGRPLTTMIEPVIDDFDDDDFFMDSINADIGNIAESSFARKTSIVPARESIYTLGDESDFTFVKRHRSNGKTGTSPTSEEDRKFFKNPSRNLTYREDNFFN